MVELVAGVGEQKDLFWIDSLLGVEGAVGCYGWPLTRKMRADLWSVKLFCHSGGVVKGRPVRGKVYYLEVRGTCVGFPCYYWVKGTLEVFNWRTDLQHDVMLHMTRHSCGVLNFPKCDEDRVFYDFGRESYRWSMHGNEDEEEVTTETVFYNRKPLKRLELLEIDRLSDEDEFSLLALE
jgi:hypothetical protein